MPVGSSFIASNCAKKMLSISKFAIDSGLAIIYTSVTNLVEKRPFVIGITGAILGCVLAFGISRGVEKLYEKLTVGVSRLCQQTTKNMNLVNLLCFTIDFFKQWRGLQLLYPLPEFSMNFLTILYILIGKFFFVYANRI